MLDTGTGAHVADVLFTACGQLSTPKYPGIRPENMRSKLPTKTGVGLLVMHVENDGPAEQAGVLLGDVLFEVGGGTVEHVDAIQDSLATAKVGDVLQIRVIRAGEIKPVSIKLGERAR